MAKKQAADEAPTPASDKLAIEHWPVAKLKPYKRNAKQHPPDQIAMIARLITEHGFDVPIVVNRKGVIVKGHGRWMAAKQLGLETVPVIAKDFTPAQEAAARIADNRVGEFGWDFDALVGDVVAGLKDGLDMSLTGFTLKDLGLEHDASGAVLHTGDPVEDAPVDTSGVIEDIAPTTAKAIVKAGQKWQLGRHTLLCGDCRSDNDMRKLFGDQKARIAVTSPPYASQRKYDETSGFKPIAPDNYVAWFEAVQANIAKILAPDGSFFLNIKEHCEEGERHLYVKDLVIAHKRAWGWNFVDEFAWTHGGTPKAPLGRFKNGWEPIFQFAFGKFVFNPDAVMHETQAAVPAWGGDHPSQDDMKMQKKKRQGLGLVEGQGIPGGIPPMGDEPGWAYPSNVLSVGKNREALGHGAAYPVGLPAFFVKAYTNAGDIVFDPFMGSGTTLVAAEQLERCAFGTELSPLYCDVIVERWQNLTGGKAKLLAK